MTNEQADLTFEAAVQELEAVVAQLESGELTLDASLSLFERGQRLAAFCNKALEQATLRVEQLTADGEIVTLTTE